MAVAAIQAKISYCSLCRICVPSAIDRVVSLHPRALRVSAGPKISLYEPIILVFLSELLCPHPSLQWEGIQVGLGGQKKRRPWFVGRSSKFRCVVHAGTRGHVEAIGSASDNPPPFVVGCDMSHHLQACLFWLQKTSSHSSKRVSK